MAGYVIEKMKGVVVLVNKWDALEKDTYTMVSYTKHLREELKFLELRAGALHQRADEAAGAYSAARPLWRWPMRGGCASPRAN